MVLDNCLQAGGVQSQGSDAAVDPPVSSVPPKSPFQKPSVQIISLSDDGSEAPTNVSAPLHNHVTFSLDNSAAVSDFVDPSGHLFSRELIEV